MMSSETNVRRPCSGSLRCSRRPQRRPRGAPGDLWPIPSRRKVRFRGHQTRVYRFVCAVVNREVLTFDDVVRHRCHNGLCINPDHLEIGSRADNKHDDWVVAAYGVDFDTP